MAREAGVDNPTGRSLSASWADFDGDGWPDLYVANDVSDNAMFRNLGDGRFRDVSHSAWVADYRGAMGLGDRATGTATATSTSSSPTGSRRRTRSTPTRAAR